MPIDLYATLGVTGDASTDDIRRAYKRLALQLHPDKNPDTSAAQSFAYLSEAHEILSSPRRREIYDAFGLDGLRLYEGAYELTRPSKVSGPVLPPVMLIGLLAAATMIIASLLIAFITLAALRFDDDLGTSPCGAVASASWQLLFVPLWLADPGILLVAALATAEAPGQLWPTVCRLLPSFTLYVCFQVLLCLRLQTPSRLSWLVVFSPLLIGRGAAIATLLLERLFPRRGAPPVALARGLGLALLFALQLSLLPPKLEGRLGWRWALVFAPCWAALLGAGAHACVACCLARKPPRAEAPPDAPDAPARAAGRLVGAVLGALLLGWVCALLEAGADGAQPARYSVLELVAPALGTLALLVVCIGCGCSSLRAARRRRVRAAGGGGSFQMPGMGAARAQRGESEPLVPSCAPSARAASSSPPGPPVAGDDGSLPGALP